MLRFLPFLFFMFMASLAQASDVKVHLESIPGYQVSRAQPTPAKSYSVQELRDKYGIYDSAPVSRAAPSKIPVPVVKKAQVLKKAQILLKPVPPPPVKPVEKAVVEKIIDKPAEKIAEKPLEKPVVEPVVAVEEDTHQNVDQRGALVGTLAFTYDEFDITPEKQQSLRDDVLPLLSQQEKSRISVYSYATAEGRGTNKAKRISLSRALQVRDFLISEGIVGERIDLFPQGSAGQVTTEERVDLILEK
jgi:outer membrane protein OmpA-like peptidoglycan-associated protein